MPRLGGPGSQVAVRGLWAACLALLVVPQLHVSDGSEDLLCPLRAKGAAGGVLPHCPVVSWAAGKVRVLLLSSWPCRARAALWDIGAGSRSRVGCHPRLPSLSVKWVQGPSLPRPACAGGLPSAPPFLPPAPQIGTVLPGSPSHKVAHIRPHTGHGGQQRGRSRAVTPGLEDRRERPGHKGPPTGSGEVPGWEVGAGPSGPPGRCGPPIFPPLTQRPCGGLPRAVQRGRCDRPVAACPPPWKCGDEPILCQPAVFHHALSETPCVCCLSGDMALL